MIERNYILDQSRRQLGNSRERERERCRDSRIE
jgi:hypothetical protein